MNEQPLIAQEQLLLEKEIQEILERCEAYTLSLTSIEEESASREQQVLTHEDRIDTLTEKRSSAQEELTQTRVEIGQLSEKRSATAAQVNAYQRALRESQTLITTAEHDISQCQQRIEEAQNSIQEGTDKLASLASEISDGTEQASALRGLREQIYPKR